jgi:hypothetical protein
MGLPASTSGFSMLILEQLVVAGSQIRHEPEPHCDPLEAAQQAQATLKGEHQPPARALQAVNSEGRKP